MPILRKLNDISLIYLLLFWKLENVKKEIIIFSSINKIFHWGEERKCFP